jgi:hypothetical protein
MTVNGNFYRVLPDPDAFPRWYLGAPVDSLGRDVDPRLFTSGVPVASLPALYLPLRRTGPSVAFNFCDFDMVVTPKKLNAKLEAIVGPAIQRIPVLVQGTDTEFEILNVCELVTCLDHSRSLTTIWMGAESPAEKIGHIRMVARLKIEPHAASGHDVFRVAQWPIALIVSERVKWFLESEIATGIKFEQVD